MLYNEGVEPQLIKMNDFLKWKKTQVSHEFAHIAIENAKFITKPFIFKSTETTLVDRRTAIALSANSFTT